MTAIGSLRVELELADGSFTTRVIRAGTTLAQLERQVRKNVVAVRRLDEGMSSFGGGVRDMVVTLGLARAALENVYNVFGRWLTSIIRVNAEVERSVVLLKNMSLAATDVERLRSARTEFNELLEMSSQAPFRLESLTAAFVKMRAAGIEPAKAQLQGLVDAVASAGGSDEQLARASIAIQQMAGKGVISMEELRQQLGEAVPRAIELMARSMNLTISQLVQRISRGQVEARHALGALSAEFSRTFGGAAIAQMETFQGRLTQLNTAWQRFALLVGGQPGSGGFFDAVKSFIENLTEGLSSIEASDFAVSLNRTLTNLTNTLRDSLRTLVEWRDEIYTVGRALLILWGAARLYAIINSIVLAVSLMTVRMTALAASTAASAASLRAFSAAATGVAASSLAQRLSGMGASMLEFGSSVAGAVSRLGFFTRLLMGLGAVGFVVGAISLIADGFNALRGNVNEANEALDRFRQGANDRDTLDIADKRLKTIAEEITQRKKLLEADRRSFQQERANPSSPIGRLQREVGRGVGGAQAELDAFLERRAQKARENADAIQRLERESAELRVQIQGAGEQRLLRQAEVAADRRLAAFKVEMQRSNAAYDQQMKALAERRKQLPEGLSKDDPVLSQLNRETEELRTARHDADIAATKNYLTQLQEARERAGEQEKTQFDAAIKRFSDYLDALKDAKKRGNLGGTIELMTAGAENNIRVAQNEITRMKARMAELRAEMQGTNPELAKVNVLLEELSRMTGLPPELKERMRAAADELGRVSAESTKVRTALTALRQIDSGFDRAEAELRGYVDQLTDPNVTESQRAFLLFQVQMEAALKRVGEAGELTGTKMAEAAGKVAAAIEAARQNVGMKSLLSYVRQGEQDEIGALARGSTERVEKRLALAKREHDAQIKFANSIKDANVRQTAISQANTAAANIAARIRKEEGDAAVTSGSRTTSMLESLQARYAELSDELNNGAGEAAKFRARLGEGPLTGVQAEIMRTAEAVDEMTKKVELATQAWGVLKSLMRQGQEGREELQGVLSMLDQGVVDPTSLDGAFIQAEARARQALAVLRAQGAEAGAIQEAEKGFAQASAGLVQGQLAREVAQWSGRNAQIRGQLAETRADRRRASEDMLANEEASIRRAIERAKLGADERKKIEDQLAEYIKSSRDLIDRDTESSIGKMLREWGNLADNIDNAWVSAFDGMADALTEFVVTGKLNFSDLANSFIRDITRIALKAAASGIFDMAGGGGANGIMGFIKGIVGGFVGGGSASTMAPVNATYAAYNHAGGIVGREGSSGLVNPAWFANAPRLHSGGYLKDDEVPTILQKGEAVFTAGQLASLGRLNRSYAFVEQTMGRMMQSLSMPQSAVPAMPVGNSAGSGSAPPVTVNIINQSGQQLEATAGTPRMDIEGMIVDVVISNIQRPGRMRDAMRGAI